MNVFNRRGKLLKEKKYKISNDPTEIQAQKLPNNQIYNRRSQGLQLHRILF